MTTQKNPHQNIEHLRAEHMPEAIAARIGAESNQSLLRDIIYGAIDGCVTTFAIVSGVVGADLSSGIVIVLGVANLVGDGFSMAASNYIGTKAELQLLEKARATEEAHIDAIPDSERLEVEEIYRQKGFDGELLDQVVEVIVSDRQRWVDTMLTEEWGLSLSRISPWKAAWATFISFIIAGTIPLLPFLFSAGRIRSDNTFILSCLLTAITFMGIGAFKSWQVQLNWFRGAMETLLVGGGAAGLAYIIGLMLKGFA